MLIKIIIGFLILLSSANFVICQPYNFYRGNLHAHSSYSDGNTELSLNYYTPADNFEYANNSLHFDFLGISEHNHNTAGMVLANYANGLSQAAGATTPSFLAVYGMEWGTISAGGHVIIYGVDSLMGWEPGNFQISTPKTDYDGLFTQLANRPNSFSYLAHPNNTDYNSIFTSIYKSDNDKAIVGIAIESGPANSTNDTYSNPAAVSGSYYLRFKELLAKGYHVGPIVDHDNHNTNFGRTTESRLVILANSLTKPNLFDAMKQRRFFASDDWNVEVNFTINNSIYMGSIASRASNPTFNISVVDPDLGDNIDYIRIRYAIQAGGNTAPPILSSATISTLNYTHSIANLDTYYYFLEIRQLDGDMIYTAPIWYTKNLALPIEITSFTAINNELEKTIDVSWETASEQNSDYFQLETSVDNITWKEIAIIKAQGNSSTNSLYSFTDRNPETGLNYYRLNEYDLDGSTRDIRITSALFNKSDLFEIYPNPAIKHICINQYGKQSFDTFAIISSNGSKIREDKMEEKITFIDVNDWIKGTYFVQFFKHGSIVTSSTFIVE